MSQLTLLYRVYLPQAYKLGCGIMIHVCYRIIYSFYEDGLELGSNACWKPDGLVNVDDYVEIGVI